MTDEELKQHDGCCAALEAEVRRLREEIKILRDNPLMVTADAPDRPGLPAAGATSMHSLAPDGHCTRCLLPAALISTPYGCCCAHAALMMPPDIGYRPGLPSVEQVREHEARCPRAGGWTTWQRQYPGNVANIVLLIAVAGAIWVADGGGRKRLTSTACQWRPCLPDGTPCQWSAR